MEFLGCLFALLVGVVFLGVAFLGSIFNFILSLFGLNKRVSNTAGNFNSQQGRGGSQQGNHSQQNQHTADSPHRKPQGKIFQKNESEYVDFEEI